MWLSLLLEQIHFGWRKQRIPILLFLAVAVIISWLSKPWLAENASIGWYTGWSVVIELATLGVAILVWLGEQHQDWVNHLPKRLDVDFCYKDKPMMACRNAVLVSEADIRNWAQQIGKQIARKNLHLEPIIEIGEPVIDLQNRVRKYSVRMFLSNAPDSLQANLNNQQIPERVCVLISKDTGNQLKVVPIDEFQNSSLALNC